MRKQPEQKKERTARQDWAGLLRRTFALDVEAAGIEPATRRR